MTTAHQSFLTQFDDARKPLVEAMLQAIDEECPDLTKIIKWNAPSFCDDGKDRLTLMLHKKDRVGLILHTGVKPKEDKKAPRLFEDKTLQVFLNGTPTSAQQSCLLILLTFFPKEACSRSL